MDIISLTGLKAEIIPAHHTSTLDQHLEGETFPTGPLVKMDILKIKIQT